MNVTIRIIRAPHAIDADSLMKLAVDQGRLLRDEIREKKAEFDRIKRILAQTMQEKGAEELTVGGVPVARVTTFDRNTVKVSELLARFPGAAVLVTSTPVVRVELP